MKPALRAQSSVLGAWALSLLLGPSIHRAQDTAQQGALPTFAACFDPDYDFPYFAEIHDWPSVPESPADAWSLPRAAVLAQLSLLVYLPEETAVRQRLSGLGFDQSNLVDRAGSQAWVFETEQDILIVFRGTEPGVAEDALTDLDLFPAPIPGGLAAHRGFSRALAAIAGELDAAIARAPQKSLWLGGHSLGGSLALLYGWQQRERVAAVYTFGAPRTFTTGSVARYEAEVPTFRVENGNDLVPFLPTPPLFAHVGETWFIDFRQDLHRNPELAQEMQTVWRGHLQFVEQWLDAWRKTKRPHLVPGPALADHAPAAYARALIAAVRVSH